MSQDKRIVMVIDTKKCIGCHTCVIACKSANNVPNTYKYNRVVCEGGGPLDTPGSGAVNTGRDDFNPANITQEIDRTCNKTAGYDFHLKYYTKACQHCETAPCLKDCPTEASWKREDGIVMMEPRICIGCNLCINNCVYSPGLDKNEMRVQYQTINYYQEGLGDPNIPPIKEEVVGKCTFCAHRLDNGLQAACVELCPGRARYIGNIKDTTSEVYKLVNNSGRVVSHIKPTETTVDENKPAVYLLE